MNDAAKASKDQLARARRAAAADLRRMGYGIIDTRGGSVDLIAVRYTGSLFVRVVLHEPNIEDSKAVRSLGDMPPSCYGEVWKAHARERGRFEFTPKRIL